MATTKRERQKAARRQKMEQMEREAKRRKNLRRAVIVAIVAVLVIGSAALLFSGKSTPTTTSTASTTTTVATTTTTTPVKRTAVTDPSPAGKFGTAPTVIVPPGAPPKNFEVSDLIAGTGAAVKTGEKLTMQYVLATYSTRKVIQSSWTSQPFSLTLGVTSLIPGWDQGLLGMHAGGRREMIIPPSLGYGTRSPGAGISKNDTLVFVVDLLKIG